MFRILDFEKVRKSENSYAYHTTRNLNFKRKQLVMLLNY